MTLEPPRLSAGHEALLYQVPFVVLVPETLRALVCQMFRPVRFSFGDEIVRQGEPPDGLYVLSAGSARVVVHHDGHEVTLGRLEAGAMFGEAALVACSERTATVRASDAVEVLRLGREAFDAVAILHPEVPAALQEHLRLQRVQRVLRTNPVFATLPLELLARELPSITCLELDDGAVLMREGEESDAAFAVESGRFVVSRLNEAVPERLGYLRAGDVVGERGAIGNAPRSATVEAVGAVSVVRLEAAALVRLVAGSPRFATALDEHVQLRDRRGTQHVPLDFAGLAPAGSAPAGSAPAGSAPADSPPADSPPADSPPADSPPADSPPADSPPADSPPADSPPADSPPADSPPADSAGPGRRRRPRRRRRYPHVEQFDETDCGVACLQMIAKYHGKKVSTTFLRDAAGTSTEGTSLRSLCTAGAAIGLDMQPYKVSRERAGEIALPAIIHWHGDHWVVLYELGERHAVIGDPASAIRRLRREELMAEWNGYAALATPTEALERAPAERRSLGWIVPILRPQRRALLAVGAFAVSSSILEVATPVVVGHIVNGLAAGRGHHLDLGGDSLLLVVLVVGAITLALGQRRMLVGVATRFDTDSVDFLTTRLLSLPMSYFAKRKQGDIERRLQSMREVRRLVVHEGAQAIGAFSLLVAIVVAMLASAPLLGLAFVVLLPLYGLLMMVSNRRVRPVLALMEESFGRYSASQLDLLKGIETVKTIGAEAGLAALMRREFARFIGRVGNAYRSRALFDTGVQAANLGTYAVFVVIGALAAHDGLVSVGAYVGFVALVLLSTSPLLELLVIFDDLQAASVLLERIHDVLAHEPEQGEDHTSLRTVPSVQGRIELRDVGFSYRDGDDPVLSGIDLSVEPGQHIAVVGRSGSGKSTLLRLVAGLTEPTSGTVLIDGVDLTTVRRRELRQRLGVVLQKPYVFARSIAENIAFGHDEIDHEAVRRAAEQSGFAEVVARLPLGYETRVGDGGTGLSGGESQLLSIARALYRQPSVLLLDEATSSLDAESEFALQQGLSRAAIGRTIVSVTHRLASARDADLVVVLERGRIVERGSHDTLLGADGVYAYLYRLQYAGEGPA